MHDANCAEARAECRAPDRAIGRHIWTVALMAVLVTGAVYGQFDARGATALLGLDLAVGVLGCALLPAVARWPVATALVLSVLAALSPAGTPLATMSALQVARWRRFPVAFAIAAAGIAAHAVQGLWRPTGGLSFGWWLALMIAGYAALLGWGAQVQARAALLASLYERARRAEAEQGRRVAEARILERARMAREMHDVLAHRLSLLATYAGALEYRPDASPEQLSRAAGVVRAGVHQALDELREVISVLRDEDAVGDDPAGGRPLPALADLPRLVEESREAGMRVRLDDRTADPLALPGTAGRTAYRVVQEGLTNARKHAAGQPIQVSLDGRPGSRLVIDISNPVLAGPPGNPLTPGTGTGLVGLTERVQLAGGRLDHEVTPTGEFRLHASLPWPS